MIKKRDEKKEKSEATPEKIAESSKSPVKTTVQLPQTPNPQFRSLAQKKSPMLRSSACQPSMSNVLADLKRATASRDNNAARETPPSEQIAPVTPPKSQSPKTDGPTVVQYKPTHQTPSQSSGTNELAQKTTNTPRQGNDSPHQLANNPSLKTKYPQDEPLTPERSSPFPSQRPRDSEGQPASLAAQQSSESEAAPIQASLSELSVEPKDTTPQKSPALARRDRRDRVRNRSFTPSATHTSSQPSAAVVSNRAESTPIAKPEQSVPQETSSPAPSNVNPSARAAARDRYARHKKMLHQRKS